MIHRDMTQCFLSSLCTIACRAHKREHHQPEHSKEEAKVLEHPLARRDSPAVPPDPSHPTPLPHARPPPPLIARGHPTPGTPRAAGLGRGPLPCTVSHVRRKRGVCGTASVPTGTRNHSARLQDARRCTFKCWCWCAAVTVVLVLVLV
jgi:hypothetical protein